MVDSRLCVLVVEDELEVSMLLSREISKCGYRVETVPDAQKAMDAAARGRHQIVVADIGLPGMDGIRLTRWIKELCPNTEVILVTANATVDTAVAAVRLGVCDYLLKPLRDVDDIRASLARASERLSQRQQVSPSESERYVDRKQLLGLLDILPLAVLLLDESGIVRRKNRFARELLQQQIGLRVGGDGRITCTNPRCDAQWHRLLTAACNPSACDRQVVVGGMRLRAANFPGGLPLLVMKLSRGTPSDAAGAILVTLPAPHLEEPDSMRILTDLYSFTPAEARLAARTLRGISLEESAKDLGIAEATARTHLRHIFAKTKTSRQGELVSALLHGPAMLRPLTERY